MNHFILLLIFLISVCFGIFGVVTLVISTSSDVNTLNDHLGALASIGSFIGSTAAFIASGAAVFGIQTWKKQIQHGKHMAIIWECMVLARSVQVAHMDFSVVAFTYTTTTLVSENDYNKAKTALENSIDDLNDQLHKLDRIVVKNEWEFSNQILPIQLYLKSIFTTHASQKAKPIEVGSFNSKLGSQNKQFSDALKDLDRKLESLEDKYS